MSSERPSDRDLQGGYGAKPIPERLRIAFPNVVPRERLRSDGLLVAFGFRCNLACSFCMVEDLLDHRQGASLEAFRAFAADADAMSGIKRVILSGGEATLEPELLDYVRIARATPGVEHVRIQTNGTRLKSRAFIDSLIDAGVDEFFVSVHAHDEPTAELITRRKNSFKDIVGGLESIAASSAALLTNTVMVSQNHQHLADIVALVAPFKPRAMEFWNLWPRIDPGDSRGHMVPLAELTPRLFEAFDACDRRSVPSVVKWYPRCLLGRFAERLDSSQPTALIDDDYWDSVPAYGCLFEAVCRHSAGTGQCSGLSHAYVHRHGWEERLLQPEIVEGRPLATPKDGHRAVKPEWLSSLGLALGQGPEGFRLESAELVGDAVRLVFRTPDARALFRLELLERNDERPCFARTRRFDLRHGPIPTAHEAGARRGLEAFVELVRARESSITFPP